MLVVNKTTGLYTNHKYFIFFQVTLYNFNVCLLYDFFNVTTEVEVSIFFIHFYLATMINNIPSLWGEHVTFTLNKAGIVLAAVRTNQWKQLAVVQQGPIINQLWYLFVEAATNKSMPGKSCLPRLCCHSRAPPDVCGKKRGIFVSSKLTTWHAAACMPHSKTLFARIQHDGKQWALLLIMEICENWSLKM